MSITHISRVLAHAPVRGSYLNLLIVIANYANDQGIAWPKVETIAEGIRLGVRQAQRIIAEMRDYGMLYVQPGTGRGHSNRYCVLVGMEPSLIPDHLARCFPKHLDDVRAFCTSQGLHFPTTNSEKGDTGTALPAQNQTGVSPFPDQIGDGHVTLSDQNQTDMSPFVPQTETGMSPFPDQIGDGHVTLSDQNQTDMSPFLQAPEQKGDIAMSNEPSWNPCVVVDDVVQQSVSKQETQPDEHKQATQPNKHKQEIQPDTDTQAAQPNKRKQETQSNTETHFLAHVGPTVSANPQRLRIWQRRKEIFYGSTNSLPKRRSSSRCGQGPTCPAWQADHDPTTGLGQTIPVYPWHYWLRYCSFETAAVAGTAYQTTTDCDAD